MLGLIALTLIPLSHSLPRVLELSVTINSLTVLPYPLSHLIFIFIDYPVFGICFQHSTSLSPPRPSVSGLRNSCGLIFWSILTATIHVPITLCALVTSVCLVHQLLIICHIYDFCVFGFIHSFTLACNSCLVACPSGSLSVFISLFLSSFLLLL